MITKLTCLAHLARNGLWKLAIILLIFPSIWIYLIYYMWMDKIDSHREIYYHVNGHHIGIAGGIAILFVIYLYVFSLLPPSFQIFFGKREYLESDGEKLFKNGRYCCELNDIRDFDVIKSQKYFIFRFCLVIRTIDEREITCHCLFEEPPQEILRNLECVVMAAQEDYGDSELR